MKSTRKRAGAGSGASAPHSKSPGGIGKLALIGAGKLGEGLLSALLESRTLAASQLEATVAQAEQARADELAGRYGIKAHTNNRQAVKGAAVVLMALKPYQVAAVLREVKGSLPKDALVISVAASVTTAMIERELGRAARVVRAMPNTPCLIRQGMTALALGKHATPADAEVAQNIFGAMGRAVLVDEKHLDAVTALSGCGPAYVYMIIEALGDAGVDLGLPRDLATQLASQTLLGASAMVLQTGEHPAKLKDVVTTPAGCTIEGLLELEDGGLRTTLIKAVLRAAARSREIAEAGKS